MDLIGKTAIVTGASKGIGLETTKILLENGVRVAGWSRTAPPGNHPGFHHVVTDVSDNSSVERAFDKTVNIFGDELSILVNNAGIGVEGSFETLEEEDWHKMFGTNVDSIFYASRLVIPKMRALGEGHIINISSIAGTNGIENMAGYCATKHAVAGLSHSMFKELRKDGIKVSCIYPGSTKTQFFDEFSSVSAHDHMMMPRDIAETILYILGTPANYLTVDVEVRPLKPKG